MSDLVWSTDLPGQARTEANTPDIAPTSPRRKRGFDDVRFLGYSPKRQLLDGRQLEVAQLVALGLADKEIAHFLDISQGTVKGYVSAVLRVLGLYRRTQICRYVHEGGLLPKS